MTDKLLNRHFIDYCIYLLAGVANKAVPFLMLPILTRFCSPEEIGQLSIFMSLYSIGIAVIGMSLASVYAGSFYQVGAENRPYLLGSMIQTQTIIVIIAALTTTGVYATITPGPPNTGFGFSTLMALIFICGLASTSQLLTTLLRLEGKPTLFAIFEISTATINIFLSIIAITVLNTGWLGRVNSWLISLAIIVSVSLFLYKKHSWLKFSRPTLSAIKNSFSIALPMIPHGIASSFILFIDKYFIKNYLGEKELGFYATALQFGMVVMIFTDSFQRAWQPWFFKALSTNKFDEKIKIVKYTYAYTVFLFFFCLIYSITVAGIYDHLVGEKFSKGSTLIIPSAFCFGIFGVYQMLYAYLLFYKKTFILALTTSISACFSAALCYFLIPIFGVMGALYSIMAAYALNITMIFITIHKTIAMPWFRVIKT